MELNTVRVKIDRKVLFETFSQEEIMEYYFGEPVKLKRAYKNPFRDDKSAKNYFFYKTNGQLVFMDFAVGKPLSCIDMANLRQDRELSYQDIYYEMSGLGTLNMPKPTIKFDKDDVLNETVIKVEVMPYSKKDLEFWAQFNITLDILKHFNVRRVNRAWINGQLRYMNVDSDPCYRYIEGDRIKLYRPLNKAMKFRNNYIHDFEGYSLLSYVGKTVVITKSMKDIMTLYSLGIPAISPKSETSTLNSDIMETLLANYQNVFLWYDADKTGEDRSQAIYEEYKDRGIKLARHDKELGKDPSDIVKNHGKEKLKEICNQLGML